MQNGRCANVKAWVVVLILLGAIIASMLVWLVRSIVRSVDPSDAEKEDGQSPWRADWYDVGVGIVLFILTAIVGIVLACRCSQTVLYVSSVPMTSNSYLASAQTPVSMHTSDVYRNPEPAVSRKGVWTAMAAAERSPGGTVPSSVMFREEQSSSISVDVKARPF